MSFESEFFLENKTRYIFRKQDKCEGGICEQEIDFTAIYFASANGFVWRTETKSIL